MKRIISILLTLCLLLGNFAPAAYAAETESDAAVETGSITVEGTNGFGSLLSAEITEAQEETSEGYEGGYSVTDLVIEGSTATVTYGSLGDAYLVVALYTEDGMQMLTSANTPVTENSTEATVTFSGEMPEYFLAAAYLVDTYDFSPLCEAYDTPMYTQDMQELLASTAEDYDADRVLQLTEDTTTNFAVYAEEVILIEYAEGVNTVASSDDEALVYVIEHADEQITSLKEGDVFAYEYGDEELLIVKVGSITVSGTSVTITGDDTLTMEEAFDIVKVEGNATSNSAEVSDLDANDGIEYVEDGNAAPVLLAIDGTVTAGKTLSFEIKEKKIESGDGNKKVTFSASWDLSVDVEVEYYISWTRSHIKLALDYETALAGSISGSAKFELASFASVKIEPVAGVTIKLDPKLELEFSGEIEFSLSLSGTLGVKLDTAKNAKNLCTAPKIKLSLEAEVSIYFGISLNPTVTLVSKKVAKLDVSVPIGLNIEVKTNLLEAGVSLGTEESIHSCDLCLDISASVSIKVKAEAKFLNSKKLTVKKSFADIVKKYPFYYSISHNQFDSGKCPFKDYLVTMLVKYEDESYAKGAEVTVTGRDGTEYEDTAVVNGHGTAFFYLPAGKYTATVTDGQFTKTSKFTISDEARQKTVTLKEEKDLGDLSASFLTALGELNIADIIDLATVVASGSCGENLTWKLSGTGVLIISGSGDMDWFQDEEDVPWHEWREMIKEVSFPKGLSSIGHHTFKDCTNLTQIKIPDGVTSLGYKAFERTGLTSVTVPGSVGMLTGSVFNDCDSLTTVTLESGPVTIQKFAFGDCDSLTGIHIPGSVKYIVTSAFYSCDSLETVTMDPGVLVINETAFDLCTALKTVRLSSTLETIKAHSFSGCWELESISMPESLVEIEHNSFSNCDSLTDVYYAGSEEQWNAINIGIENDCLTSATIHYNSTGPDDEAAAVQNTAEAVSGGEAPTVDAVYNGAYSTETTDTYTVKKAAFSGLVPGAEYLLLSMASVDTEAPIDSNNLLYIGQAAAGEDGTLTFTYIQRVTTDPSFVVACGASSKSLVDASITFPDMTADGEFHAVDPTVVYDGVTLVEGRDYEITGTVSYTEAGTYVCCIRGIHSYTGMVKCTYSVAEPGAIQEPGITRIFGDNRYETGFGIAEQLKQTLGVEKFQTIIVAYGKNFPDALTGSYLAAVKDAPILLTEDKKQADVIAYIAENLAEGGTVYILGGVNAIPSSFETALAAKNITAQRLAGDDRYQTNLAILAEAGVTAEQEILICTGNGFADSLSASAAGLPVLLVGKELKAEQKDFLATTSGKFVIIGGTSAVSAKLEAELKSIGTVERLGGETRYETSVLVAQRFVSNPSAAILAYAKNFPDGLCGGPLAYALGAPLILTDTDHIDAADTYIEDISSGIVVGGPGLISDGAVRNIFDLSADAEINVK